MNEYYEKHVQDLWSYINFLEHKIEELERQLEEARHYERTRTI